MIPTIRALLLFMASSWKSANKFRLITLVVGSLLASAASVDFDEATVRTIFYTLVQASLVGVAYLQCPGDRSGSN